MHVTTKKNCPDGALDRNTAQLSIGTAMHSGLERRKSGRVFSYLYIATFKYSYTVIVHHITHEILNNIVIITKVHQMIEFPCRFLNKVQFCLQKFEIKNENVDCEVFKKPNVMKFTPQDTGKASPFQP